MDERPNPALLRLLTLAQSTPAKSAGERDLAIEEFMAKHHVDRAPLVASHLIRLARRKR